jgi:hypothetical protein
MYQSYHFALPEPVPKSTIGLKRIGSRSGFRVDWHGKFSDSLYWKERTQGVALAPNLLQRTLEFDFFFSLFALLKVKVNQYREFSSSATDNSEHCTCMIRFLSV